MVARAYMTDNCTHIPGILELGDEDAHGYEYDHGFMVLISVFGTALPPHD